MGQDNSQSIFIIVALIGAAGMIMAAIASVLTKAYVTRRHGVRSSVLRYGDMVSLLTHTGKYVRCDWENRGRIHAYVDYIQDGERFRLVDPLAAFSKGKGRPIRYGGNIALQAKNNDRFVRVDYTRDACLFADAARVQEWETLTIVSPNKRRWSRRPLRFGDSIAMRACSGDFVQTKSDAEDILVANVEHIQAWEIFTLVDPSPGE